MNDQTRKASPASIRSLLTVAAVIASLTLAAGSASAQLATVLHSFNDSNNGSTDLNQPYGALIADKAGNFYGTALNGGTGVFYGGVFELSPPAAKGGAWKEKVLYNFPGGADGQAPFSALVMDASSNLYGTTASGGAAGYGTVFELSPPVVQGGPWTQAVLYSFTNGDDGSGPVAALVFDENGNLYGTANGGGSGAGGTIFELSPPTTSGTWTFATLYSFTSAKDSATGCQPEASLLPAQNGSFYGTTIGCGTNGGGVAFELSPPTVSGGEWTYTVIHVFGFKNGTGDGNYPQANLIAGKGGVLFGTTLMGGTAGLGTVYSLTPQATKGGAWKESVPHSFTSTADGYNPVGPVTLAANGTLYGTTAQGGGNFDGNIFKLTPPAVSGGSWTLTQIYICSSATTSPSNPEASLSLINGALYSTSVLGGAYGQGTVFKLVP